MTEPVYIEATASFDSTRTYRYTLLRRWAEGPSVLWVMLNPSTADEERLDPTLRRCLQFTRSWGMYMPSRSVVRRDALAAVPFGAFEACNLYAFRSTKPKGLWRAADPVGPNNDAAIQSAAKRASLVIVGWGTNAKPERERRVAQILSDVGVVPHALGTCSNGAPLHPLARGKMRVPDTARPSAWHAKGLR